MLNFGKKKHRITTFTKLKLTKSNGQKIYKYRLTAYKILQNFILDNNIYYDVMLQLLIKAEKT